MPEKKEKSKLASSLFFGITILVIVVGLLLLAFSRQVFGDEVGDAILGKDVPNGFVAFYNFLVANISAIIWSILTIGILIVISCVLYFIINICLRRTARLKTIASLLKSLVKYAAVIAAICIILGIWGVNVAAIFASLGIVALIIGLGCKTLVNDIVSGFFIVVDNYFEVGDKVTIDGFTGFVQTIGLRTTKIKDWCGNLKSINNSLITSVVNFSRYNSFASVSIDISFNEDLERVEAIIAKNLDSIKEKIPEIDEGPFYKGVDALDDCGIRLMFLANVEERNRVAVQRKLLRELYLLFVENDVIIPFKQIVVNGPDPLGKPRATKEEKEISKELVHGKKDQNNEGKKKANKITEAILKASNDTENY